MRLKYWELLLINLEGKFDYALHPRVYMPADKALEILKQASGKNFGYDVRAWKEYIQVQGGPKNALPGLYGKTPPKSDNA
jgi:hypothetical protein